MPAYPLGAAALKALSANALGSNIHVNSRHVSLSLASIAIFTPNGLFQSKAKTNLAVAPGPLLHPHRISY